MGCEMSCDRPHARTECLIDEVLSVYSTCACTIGSSLVPRPSYEKIEKGSGQTCIGAVFLRNARGPRTVQCGLIRFE